MNPTLPPFPFRNSSRKSLVINVLVTLGGVVFSLLLWGCNEHSQELDERVTQLQKQLDSTESELQSTKETLRAANDELASLKNSPVPGNTPAQSNSLNLSSLPSRSALEQSYSAAAKELKKMIQAQLKEFTLETCTLHNVEIPSNDYPVTSKLSLSLHSSSGTKYQLDLPVKADATGRWVFPDTNEIVRQIEQIRKTAHNEPTSETAPSSAPASTPQRSTVTSSEVPGGQKTVVIQWPESGQSGGGRNSAPNPESTEAPKSSAPNQSPRGSIPADRDVLIRF